MTDKIQKCRSVYVGRSASFMAVGWSGTHLGDKAALPRPALMLISLSPSSNHVEEEPNSRSGSIWFAGLGVLTYPDRPTPFDRSRHEVLSCNQQLQTIFLPGSTAVETITCFDPRLRNEYHIGDVPGWRSRAGFPRTHENISLCPGILLRR